MESYPNSEPRTLSDSDRQILEVGSATSPEVIDARGVWSINRPGELPDDYSERQRRRAPGMLFTIHRPNGKRTTVFRPGRAYAHKPGWKYEQIPKDNGGGNVLDVHPFCQAWIEDTDVPVIFVEGTKKADALVTAFRRAGVRVVVVAIVGVWNWLHDGSQPIPDMYDIPLEGRSVTVMFDSDVLSKWQVQLAAKRLAEHAEGRGAEVYVTYFADQADGSKVGADDFFAAGGTLTELRLLTRRYNPDDFVKVRLSRDERLAAMIADLQRRYEAMLVARIGHCSDRATMRAAIARTSQSGKVTDKGLVVRLPVRPMCKATRLSTRSQFKSLQRLERDGYLERIEEPEEKVQERGRAYLLYADYIERAEGKHHRRESPQQGVRQEQDKGRAQQKPHSNADSYAGVYPARASDAVPELRHSKCVHAWGRRDGRRVVVDSEYIYRLAKQRQEVVMYLLDNGGEAPEAELLERFGSKSTRMRDFRKRRIAPLTGWRYSRDKETGEERELEVGPALVVCEGPIVRLLPEWRDALEEHRRRTDEHEDNRQQEERLDAAAKDWRERDRTPADTQTSPLMGKERNKRNIAVRAREDRRRWVEEQRRKVGMTAMTFLADEIDGEYGVRFGDAAERWRNLHGGAVSELWRAAHYGPFVFRRVQGDLFIDPEPSEAGGARPEPPNDPMKHPLDCECLDCSARAPSYARAVGGAA